jgi:hypothetical protein
MGQMTDDVAKVASQLKGIIDYVRDCQARVTKGEIMELQGLDKNVIDICDAIAHLPEKEGHALESQMTQLIDSLEVLARTMKEQQEHLSAPEAR